MSQRDIKFTDYRYHKARYHFCPKVALKIEVNNDTDTILFAFAVCSPKDNFSRKYARVLLDERITDENQILGGQYNRERTLLENCQDITARTVDIFNKSKEPFHDQKFERDVKRLHRAFMEIEIQKGIDLFEDAFGKMLDNPDPDQAMSVMPLDGLNVEVIKND